ncbi:hypothetical protein BABINDRAFT_160492 [Babjeviella inositovora NRRL Y-12698]|uniref:Guanine nucleotide-binding protein alpha-2 subunit n=1 Tax=Babjeviella inositovora NRRL Y-12698 TaxID=984486 RepID=A0A1E3QTS1_9ASCO|nr:uncharacterized protein BABINDRAFT_160492 [Babjeviella inositovora NRRL Y-12698]ODQ81081.1 hypothetical protein BABINDRAFT_160492 [Babjeviella inositovora NRRL Y-12698]
MGICASKDDKTSATPGQTGRTGTTVPREKKPVTTAGDSPLSGLKKASVGSLQPHTVSSTAGSGISPSANGTTDAKDPHAISGSPNDTHNDNTQSPHDNSLANGTAGSTAPKKEIKILLLGSGESGKSTIIKQMKILHQNGFSDEEKADYKTFVFRNIVECVRNLISGVRDIKPELIAPGGKIEEVGEEKASDPAIPSSLTNVIYNDDIEQILAYEPPVDPSLPFDSKVADKILAFFKNSNIQTFITQYRSAFYLPDSTNYFLDSLPRISAPDYVPDVTDILRTRKKTSGIYDTKFQMGGGLDIHMYDVGGQRSERKKWIHCFDDVTLIIFCVALSEYDQVLLEENSQNRLEESLILFDSVINSRWFLRTSVVLFLNKIDVFAEKLPHSPMENFFPDYSGGNDINKAAKYILWRFNQANRSGLNIYPHVTQATDTSNIELVFAAVRETILQNSLKDSGIL